MRCATNVSGVRTDGWLKRRMLYTLIVSTSKVFELEFPKHKPVPPGVVPYSWLACTTQAEHFLPLCTAARAARSLGAYHLASSSGV